MISADPEAWYKLSPDLMGEEAYADIRKAIHRPETLRGMIEDIAQVFASITFTTRRIATPAGKSDVQCSASGRSGTISKRSTAIPGDLEGLGD